MSVARALQGLRATTLEDHQARRLVGSLDATERQILECLMSGMSKKDTAALMRLSMEDVERGQASMMSKLSAVRTADAVRIGLPAGLHLLS
jgi:FixJ family two-component response regulator